MRSVKVKMSEIQQGQQIMFNSTKYIVTGVVHKLGNTICILTWPENLIVGHGTHDIEVV